jgi:transposase
MARIAEPINTEALPDDVNTLKDMIVSLVGEIHNLQGEVGGLRHRLDLLLRQRYGASAEKIDRTQLALFAADLLKELDAAAAETESGDEPVEAETVASRPRRNGRRRLPANLERVPVTHTIPAAERACPCCGGERHVIGYETSEQLDYVPAKCFVLEHRCEKLACRACEAELSTASKPAEAVERCLAAPGLLAQVAVSKFGDHLPLHRLENIFRRHDVDLARSTMCDWMASVAEAFEPIVTLMSQEIRQSRVIHTDDSPVPVQEKGRGKTKQGRFWAYAGDRWHPYAVFDYTPTRERAGPVDWLTSFRGFLQADAYAGYRALYETGKVAEVACWAHARRKFHEARTTAVAECHRAIAWIKRLYAVEREAKEKKLSPRARRALRQEKAVPVLASFQAWLDEQSVKALPKSPLGEAVAYVRNRWESFVRYTEHGSLSIDNNAAENALRRVALGRKNWLFAGSDKGGRTAATLFSVIASCARHGVDPYHWMRDVLERLPTLPMSRLPELLPDRWGPVRG